MTSVVLNKSRAIRVLNDNFRSTFTGGRVVTTAAVADLPLDVKALAFIQVQGFAEFNANNDPYARTRLRQLRTIRRDVLLEDRLLRRAM
jgi:hypothetical protein